jgi:hypothetical protein
MSSSSLRWRRASRKSPALVFPGAWPNSSGHDSILTGSDVPEVSHSVESEDHTTTWAGHITDSGRRLSDVSHHESVRREPARTLQHIDHVTDFHRRLSFSLTQSRTDSIGSLPALPDLQIDTSCTVSLLNIDIYLHVTHKIPSRRP